MDKGKRCSGCSLKVIEKQMSVKFLQRVGGEKKLQYLEKARIKTLILCSSLSLNIADT